MLTNTPGVLDEDGKLLTGLTPRQIDDLVADGTISGGMLPEDRLGARRRARRREERAHHRRARAARAAARSADRPGRRHADQQQVARCASSACRRRGGSGSSTSTTRCTTRSAQIFPSMHDADQRLPDDAASAWTRTGANAMRRGFWPRYGTTLNGLMRHHGTDPRDFLAATHRFPELGRPGGARVGRAPCARAPAGPQAHLLQCAAPLRRGRAEARSASRASSTRSTRSRTRASAASPPPTASGCCCAATTSTLGAARWSTTRWRTCAPPSAWAWRRCGCSREKRKLPYVDLRVASVLAAAAARVRR